MNKILISIHATVAEPDPISPLAQVWVLVYGLPRGCTSSPHGDKIEHILKVISEPLGKLLSVDRSSLDGDGPTRIEISCPAPAEVDGLSLIFYFSTRGQQITYELESPEAEGLLGTSAPLPPTPPPSSGGCDGDGDPSEGSLLEEEDDDPVAPDSGCRSLATAT
ncbi:hypothetical protein ZWY2020_048410 [Hordeum vulgare]|nr:hypothetical protein ZWY2020_048410 [Hordeum vulgare]